MTAGNGLHIASDDREHAILVADEDSNDIAEFYHRDHATVDQSYETALGLAQKLVGGVAQGATTYPRRVEYGHDAKGNIVLPQGAPFDGEPVLIKLGSGWVEARWEDHDKMTDSGFGWVVLDDALGFTELGDAQEWSPLPGVLAEGQPAKERPDGDELMQFDLTSDGRWNKGCDFAMEQLCRLLGVDQGDILWDAATETVDGDVQSVLCNILRAKYGDEWSPKASCPSPAANDAELIAELQYEAGMYQSLYEAAVSRLSQPGIATDYPIPPGGLLEQLTNENANLRAQVERLTVALKVCGAPYSTPPGTVAQCQAHIAVEFQRRLDTACSALASTEQP